MIRAMAAADFEPIVIEDLVRFGEDRGFERGLARGIEQGRAQGVEHLRGALLELIAVRLLKLNAEERKRIDAERDPDVLRAWISRAARVGSAAEIFSEPP